MTQLIPLASLRLPATSDRITGFLGSPAGASFVKAREALLRSLLVTEEMPDGAAEGPVTAGQGLALIQVIEDGFVGNARSLLAPSECE
jgi:hypothetical protein